VRLSKPVRAMHHLSSMKLQAVVRAKVVSSPRMTPGQEECWAKYIYGVVIGRTAVTQAL